MRLIDADRLKEVLEKNFGHTGGASVLEQLIDEQPTIQPDVPDTNVGDKISRQAAIDALDCINGTEEVLRSLPPAQPEYRLDEWCMDCKEYDQEKHCCPRFNRVIREAAEEVRQNAQPEPAIPLSWIENEIKWLKSLDSTFSEIIALQISAMVNKWRDEKK